MANTKTKLILLGIVSAILSCVLVIYSQQGLARVSPDEIAARLSADQYNQKAEKQLNAAAIYDKTQNFKDIGDKCRSVADSLGQLATGESNRALRLQSLRVNFYKPFFNVGIIFAILCPIFLVLAWLIPSKQGRFICPN